MSTTPRVRPFPWHALATVTASQASSLRHVRRWAAAHADLPQLMVALADLLEARVEVLLQRAQPLTDARGIPGGAGALMAAADSPQLERAMLFEADMALVAAAMARVTRRKPARVADVGASASPQVAGALGAILAAALRRSHQGRAMRVLAAGPAPALEADMARLGRELLAVTLTILLGDDAYEARLVVPLDATLPAPPSSWSVRQLRQLDAAPLSIPLVAHALAMTTAELASLAPGDALMLGSWPLARSASGALAGPMMLAAPAAATGVAVDLAADGRLVLRGDVVPLCPTEAAMGEAGGGLIEAMGEVPVVVRVELGEARMAARDWAALGRGDVVTLGRRVGEAVILRVGGVPVARGDLVDVDGEVGVRIVERLADREVTQ